ncbi:10938_t:CDS:2 [Dentiscutata erythropus]|uniref:10938_t:CDS:1 n=1 Tax=Dentiscutata erythropus TaxID=1348616 RepID=A0A9N8WIK9_9GLOM|nr:10938_t:CDS:2 [Dentiscutata erythropus]
MVCRGKEYVGENGKNGNLKKRACRGENGMSVCRYVKEKDRRGKGNVKKRGMSRRGYVGEKDMSGKRVCWRKWNVGKNGMSVKMECRYVGEKDMSKKRIRREKEMLRKGKLKESDNFEKFRNKD